MDEPRFPDEPRPEPPPEWLADFGRGMLVWAALAGFLVIFLILGWLAHNFPYAFWGFWGFVGLVVICWLFVRLTIGIGREIRRGG